MRQGDQAPDFELTDHTGALRSLDGLLAEGPVVLFFYPAALTAGCTAEGCHFRDLAAEFAELGAQRVGISRDPVDRQREFAETHKFDYPLLADPDGTVAALFGVRRSGLLSALAPTRRMTFVIAADRAVIGVIGSETRMQAHADGALKTLRAQAAR